MDRLEEANKVTTLMRRRENPRQISAARLMCNSALEQRGFLEPKPLAPRTEISAFAPVLPGPAAPRVTGGGDRYKPPRATRLLATGAFRRADTSRMRINGRGTSPMVPPRRQKLLARITQAPLVSLRCESPAPPAAPRDYGMSRHSQTRVHLGNARLAPGPLEVRRALSLDHQPSLRSIQTSPLQGHALRVSVGVGFRAPAVSWRSFVSRPPAAAAFLWPRTPRVITSESQDFTAANRNLEIEIPRFRASLPKVTNRTRPATLVFPGSVETNNRRPASGAQPAKRATDVSWSLPDPSSKGMAVVPPSAGFAQRNGAHVFNIVLLPSTTHPVRQVAFAAFAAREPVGCPKVTFEGTVAAAIAGAPTSTGGELTVVPPPAKPAAMVRIEEHFGEGWDNWVGGVKEWKVDVAGVRTGPLALYKPTLELIDYELEFLARIDTRSLNWAVRAAGLDEYLLCTLTAVPGGELEFSRRAVVGGKAQEPVISPQRLPGKPRSAITVGTRASGDTFTVSVDGNSIDSWDDDRFPMGGIGFTGAPDDRARLYWVRLSSTELSAKEHQNT